jgi:arylsulfatase A-like enzyme
MKNVARVRAFDKLGAVTKLLYFPKIILLALLLCVVDAHAARRPNIVLILADDMGFSDLGCYGSEIQTPNLDKLAAGGLRFTQFYNTARCCPTRAALMTGLYSHQAGVGHMVESMGRPIANIGLPGYAGDLSPHCVTIAQVLSQAGYHTAMSGKWHVTPAETTDKKNWPRQRGFEKYFGIIHGAASYFDPSGILIRDNESIGKVGTNFYLTDAIASNAVKFIDTFAKEQKPFFMYVAFTAPHWPVHALPEDIAKYRGKYGNNWEKFREARYRKQIELGIIDAKWKLTPRDLPGSWSGPEFADWQDSRMAGYAAQIDRLDQNVGKILAKLRDSGQGENTLVFFLSDNGACAEHLGPKISGPIVPTKSPTGGPMRKGNRPDVIPGGPDTYASYGQPWANVSNTPFRLYKHWVHEGGISTPLICNWPGVIKAGTMTSQPGHLIDIMATCVDVAGASYPKTFNGQTITAMEGISLFPVLEGKKRKGHEAIFWEHEGNRAVRSGKWKLVSKHPDTWELYDMEADRTELHNVAAEHPAQRKKMIAMYDAWAKRADVVPWDDVQRRFKQAEKR